MKLIYALKTEAGVCEQTAVLRANLCALQAMRMCLMEFRMQRSVRTIISFRHALAQVITLRLCERSFYNKGALFSKVAI